MTRSPTPIRLPLAVVACLSAPSAAADPLVPRDVFFGNPQRTGVRIDPDGDAISYLAADGGVMNVWIQPIESPDEARVVTTARDRPISSYFWMPNGEQIVYAQDRGGDENFHLYAVNVDDPTAPEIDLTPMAGVQARVVHFDRDHPNDLLIATNDRVAHLHDVHRVNTRTGSRRLVLENTGGWIAFAADANLDLRLVTSVRSDGGMTVRARDTTESPWYELIRWSAEDAAASAPLGFSRDGGTIYLMDARGSNTGELRAYGTDDEGEPTYETLARHHLADVADVVSDPETGHPQAVAFDYDRREWTILDPDLHATWDQLTRVADGEMAIVSRDRADRRWIVGYERDDGPYAYYLFDRDSGAATFLFSNRPELDDISLAKMEPVVIPARDGLGLVSYLTRPAGADGDASPMVLLVHGGPWARDAWGYNPYHQWLANRGYAVLSVNYRGSSGFGKSFLNAGNLEWAGRMHDDLIDAVNWAVQAGIADADRVAIMGGSYGGYATLVGLTFTPDFFAAGVDIVGPSNVRTLLDSIPAYWEPIRAMFERRVGSSDDPDFLDAISPLSRVDEIRRPLLIGQGANDPRVKEAEARQIVEAMESHSIPVTYVVFPDEGHGFRKPENNVAFNAVIEVFLAQHLGGRAEPIESAVRQSSARVEAGAELIPGLEPEFIE